MVRISIADPIFYPVAGVLTSVFVLLLLGFIPQAEAEIDQRANLQTSSLEIQSMVSTLFHGYSYSADDGTDIRDSQAISYMICGKDPSTSWLEIFNEQEYIDTGNPQIPAYFEFKTEFTGSDPANCESATNYWNAPESIQGVDSTNMKSIHTALLPVRGGGVARVKVLYGVE